MRSFSIFGNISQRQIEQLDGSIVIGEMAAIFNDFSELHVQALDGIGRVNNLSHLGGVGEKRDDLLPLPFPDQRDGRVFLAPRALGNASKASRAFSAVLAR